MAEFWPFVARLAVVCVFAVLVAAAFFVLLASHVDALLDRILPAVARRLSRDEARDAACAAAKRETRERLAEAIVAAIPREMTLVIRQEPSPAPVPKETVDKFIADQSAKLEARLADRKGRK